MEFEYFNEESRYVIVFTAGNLVDLIDSLISLRKSSWDDEDLVTKLINSKTPIIGQSMCSSSYVQQSIMEGNFKYQII